ncbi:MobQ family relaxase [Acetobacter malorum]|uniref:MobQ family relaxase n=1 Tax=Acetobacter malorum TaxID=178901 RepID=UPI000B221146|nr:MobQ family relaxase [Acetobacter malorum]
MAIFSLSVKSLNRKSGKSAVAAAAYRSCSKLTDERDGQTYDFRKKQSLADPADSFIIAPYSASWAQDRSALWNAAEAAENRGNSTTAREWLAALPAELDADEQRALVQQFASELVTRFGVAADVSIHEPSRDGDQRNRHAHILTTTRTVGADGLGKKTRELDVKTTASAAVEKMRQRWAELANSALEKAGQRERIDNRSYERQGIDKEPELHLGAKATKAKRAGLQHPRLDRARDRQFVREIKRRAKAASKPRPAPAAPASTKIAVLSRRKAAVAAARAKTAQKAALQTAPILHATRRAVLALETAHNKIDKIKKEQRIKAEEEAAYSAKQRNRAEQYSVEEIKLDYNIPNSHDCIGFWSSHRTNNGYYVREYGDKLKELLEKANIEHTNKNGFLSIAFETLAKLGKSAAKKIIRAIEQAQQDHEARKFRERRLEMGR